MRNDFTMEVEFEYAVRMVRMNFATPAQAARTCGVPLAALLARLDDVARPNTVGVTRSFVKGLWEHV
jgi:hypothetical protein